MKNLFWQQSLSELFQQLHTTVEGLNEQEASLRLQTQGPNLLHPPPRKRLLFQFLARFKNPLVLLLLGASGISAFTGDKVGFITILLIVLLSVILDFVQEYRAGKAAEMLKNSVTLKGSVLRDGKPREISVSNLVQGDVVLLSAGNLVPADARVLEAKDFFVNQSLLTGESYPVEKHPTELEKSSSEMIAASNAVFMGSSVISGSARVLICQTASQTALGEISESLLKQPPPTSFMIGTQQFGMFVLSLTFGLVFFVLLVNTLFHRAWLESFLFAVALAVGLTPELLPMVVSVTLSRGAIRMAKKKVIVKRLSAVQDLGAMDILCTDKTGTLTEACIRLERHVNSLGQDSEKVLKLAYLNSAFETGLKSPLDEAILKHEEIDIKDWHKIDEVPFDFERRRVSVLIENKETRLLVVKGAPEDILRLCTSCEVGESEKIQTMDDLLRKQIQTLFENFGKEGFRVLGVAWHKVAADHPHAVVTDETELVFSGFAAFLDPPKLSAAQAIQDLEKSGIAVKILTGDNELVTQQVCKQLGFKITGLLTGAEIQKLDDLALRVQAEKINLFCRVNPNQKNRILLALKARGHVVGFLGDGVNDAPSIHSADVGLSVDSAVDVAKAAADMILLEHDLQVLHEGVREGRRTFGNVLKYIMMGMSSNFGNMFSMAGATLLLPFLPMLPVQILLNNLLYDISEITLPFDHVDEEYLLRPRRWDMAFIRKFMFTFGPISSLFDFLTFFILLHIFHAGEKFFHTGWFIESIATQVLVIFLIRTRKNIFASRPHPALIATSLAVLGIACTLPFTSLGNFLGLLPLPFKYFGILALLLLFYLSAVEFMKYLFYRYLSPSQIHLDSKKT